MSDYLKELSSEFSENLKLNYDLKKKNWFNIGGKTKIYYKAKNLKELIKFLKKLDNKNFTFYYYMTNFCNSNIIALNFLANNIKSKYVWESISVDEIYSLKKWGSDKEIIDNLIEKKNYFKEIIKFKLIFNI